MFGEMECECGIPYDIWTICAQGDVELLAEFLNGRLCKNIYKYNREGWTPLMYACYNKHEKIVSMLVKAGVSVDNVNYRHQTALMLACSSGNVAIVQLVFSKKIVNYVDNEGYTALHHAVNFKQEEIVEFLLRQGADPDLFCNGLTPLMHATRMGNMNITNMLLRHGANRYLVNSNNEMAINIAFKHGHVKVGYCLMDKQGVESLEHFLQSINLEQYWPLFENHGISMSDFINLNEEDFKALGIKLLGPRRRMSLALAELKKQKELEKRKNLTAKLNLNTLNHYLHSEN